jgi:sec-independent protein translocase protein TatA
MLGLRLPELLLILAVVLIIFGANKLPQLGAGLGKGIQSFKRAFSEGRDEPPAEQAPPSLPTAGAKATEAAKPAEAAKPTAPRAS